MSILLSNPEEMIGKTISWISTGSKSLNIGFIDGTCYSIKIKEIEWDVKDHLKKIKEANERMPFKPKV